jgi:hypothetical protein
MRAKEENNMPEKVTASDEAEATARAINAGPWEPFPGLVKRQCPQCYGVQAADQRESAA